MQATKHQASNDFMHKSAKEAIGIHVSKMAAATGHDEAEVQTLTLFIKHNAAWLRAVFASSNMPEGIPALQAPKHCPSANSSVTDCAVAYAKALQERDNAQHALHVAYDVFKGVPAEIAGQGFIFSENFYIERGTCEWDAMMEATSLQYEVLKKAKAKVRRAHAKMLKAIPA